MSYNTPGLVAPKSFTVYPTVIVVETLEQHSASQDAIDFASTVHALKSFGSARRKARALIRASSGNQLSSFSVY